MIPAFTEGPFYRYGGQELCFYCDSHRYNEFFYCDVCKDHKTVAPDAKQEARVDNGPITPQALLGLID